MKISDLSHLEVVSEALSILGSISYSYHSVYAISNRKGISITFPSNGTLDVSLKSSAPNTVVAVCAPNAAVEVSVSPSSTTTTSAFATGSSSFVSASVAVHS